MLNGPGYHSTDIRINSCIPAVPFEVQLQLEGWNECLVQAGCTVFCGIMPRVGITAIHHGAGCFVIRHCSASLHKSTAMWDPINILGMKDLTHLCRELECKEKDLPLLALWTAARTTTKAGAFVSEPINKGRCRWKTQTGNVEKDTAKDAGNKKRKEKKNPPVCVSALSAGGCMSHPNLQVFPSELWHPQSFLRASALIRARGKIQDEYHYLLNSARAGEKKKKSKFI